MPSRWSQSQAFLAEHEFFEALEERALLYTTAFLTALPTTDMMTNPANTVVRMQTNGGFVDIELYDRFGPAGASAAPISTANFLNYVNSGRYDNTFFHRLASGFVLQGGGFSFLPDASAPPRVAEVRADPPIRNEFDAHRSNIEETLAMAKLGGDPNSATSEFFFNLADNSSNLDGQNGGFTVFAHVIQGWSVVTGIGALQTQDLSSFLGGPQAGAFTSVPLTDISSDTSFVTIIDAEVIKPAGSQQFFSQSVVYPDGYRSRAATDTIDLANTDPNAATPFQVVLHYETGQRDQVIYTNTLAPGAHIEIPLSAGGIFGKARAGTPYSIEVRSAKPIGATLHHKDFAAVAAEAFVQTDPYTLNDLVHWNLPGGVKGSGDLSFLSWYNLRGQDATVNLAIYPDGGGTPYYTTVTTGAYRRGGFNISDTAGIPEGRFSVFISSSGPIVVSMSQYVPAANQSQTSQASTASGVIGFGASKGVIPGAYVATGGQALISAMFTGTTPALVTVDLDFVLTDGTVLHSPGAFILSPAIPRRDVDLIALNPNLPRDEFFTIRYHVQGDTAPVALAYDSTVSGDSIATSFQTGAASTVAFGGGETNRDVVDRDVISIYNPFSDAATILTYRVTFHFAVAGRNVVIPANGTGTLAGGHRVDLNVRDYSDILQLINSDARYDNYTISIEGTFANGSTTIDGGGFFAQLTHFAFGDNSTSGPGYLTGTPLVPATDSRFA